MGSHGGIWIFGMFFVMFASASATLEISVATDKPIYQLGETMQVSVSVYNPTSEAVTMYISYPIASYLMDDTYFWHQNKVFPAWALPPITMQPGQIQTWQRDHSTQENTEYFLNLGNHSVKGIIYSDVTAGQYSDPVEFQVIPEPATIVLFCLGGILIRA